MRISRPVIDTDSLSWQPVNEVLQQKVLNGDPKRGPHTLLLRSEPRAPGPDFAQFHPIDEEFYCLGGDFTFDGSMWFREGSYAFYPARFVHAAQVHVRGGYFIYLRLSGESELFTVSEPRTTVPYYVGEGEPRDQAVQLADAAAALTTAEVAAGKLLAAPLYLREATGEGSTMVAVPGHAVGRLIDVKATGVLEILALSGTFALPGGGAPLRARSYFCDAGRQPHVSLECREAGKLIISHGGSLHLS